MKDLKSRIEGLEATAKKWRIDNTIYESFEQENSRVREIGWAQKVGRMEQDWREFETPIQAFDWVRSQLGRGDAQIYVDDIRSLMTAEEREAFDLLFLNAPEYKVMFEIRSGQDVIPEAIRRWKQNLSGVVYREWWKRNNEHINDLLSEQV